jgi:hypothetical protein
MRIILAFAGLFAFFAVLVIGSCLYLGYRFRKEAGPTREAYKSEDVKRMAKATRAGPTAPTPVNLAARSLSPAAASRNLSFRGMASETERTVGGPEADLVVRVGAVNNLGFGWPKGFDPFSGNSTPPHHHPWTPYEGAPAGMKRILLGSSVNPSEVFRKLGDGYRNILGACRPGSGRPVVEPCKARQDSMPMPITIPVGELPAKVQAVLFQMFVDDFQAPVMHSHFQVTLNGRRIPSFEAAINSLNQSGPIGKLVTLNLLPEYWPLLQSGTVKLLFDDPTTGVGDGYAIDFVRILANPRGFTYQVSLEASVLDADTNSPIAGSTVAAALATATTAQCRALRARGIARWLGDRDRECARLRRGLGAGGSGRGANRKGRVQTASPPGRHGGARKIHCRDRLRHSLRNPLRHRLRDAAAR